MGSIGSFLPLRSSPVLFGEASKAISATETKDNGKETSALPGEVVTALKKEDPPVKKAKKKNPIIRALKSVMNMGILLMAFAGGGQVYNEVVGDGPMPRMTLNARVPSNKLQDNNTQGIVPANMTDESLWVSLQPTVDIINSVSPDLAKWVREMHAEGKIEFKRDASKNDGVPDDAEELAFFNFYTRKLIIHPTFWQLENGDKAAVIAHEYRHSRQNFGKIVATRTTSFLALHPTRYDNQLEDEAYLFERAFYKSLGVNLSMSRTPHQHEVAQYLRERQLTTEND